MEYVMGMVVIVLSGILSGVLHSKYKVDEPALYCLIGAMSMLLACKLAGM